MRKLKLLIAAALTMGAAVSAEAAKTVYLNPGEWDVADATERYALYMFNSDTDNAWVSFTKGADGVWSAEFDDSYASMILCRMNGSEEENIWANKWGQTGNITAPVIDGLTFTITSNDSNNSSYTVSGNTYLYNVGANAYLENGASWGTHAALKSAGFAVNLTAGNGVYTIGTNSKYAGKVFGLNGYVDNGEANQNWTLEPVEGQNAYKLKSNATTYAFAAPGMYNVKLGADPGNNKAYWRFVTDTKRNDVNFATNLSSVELTHKINNPRFDDNANGWEDAPARGGNTGGSNGDADSYDDRNPCAEHYNKTYDTYQTLTGLANGTYAVSVQGFYRQGGYVDAASKHAAGTESLNAILYANSQEQPLMSIFEEAGKATGGSTKTAEGINGAFPDNMAAASYFFSAGLYWNTVYVTVTDGTLKIGIKKSTAVGSDWTIFDNFRLQYFGNCTIAEAQNGALIVAYNEALSAAQNLAAMAMEASAKSALNSAIAANTLETSSATAEQLSAATTALNAAVAAAQPSADVYSSIRTLLDGLKTQDATFDGETKYNAGTYTALSEVYADYYAYAINTLSSDAGTDYTKVIVNPSFEFGNTLGWTYKPSNDHGAKTYALSGKDGQYIFNIWSAGYAITQSITGLPKGLYELKALVGNSSDGDPAKVYLIANDNHEGITCDINGDTGVEGSVKVVVGDDGKLTIGAVGSNNDAERSYSEVGVWWYKVDNFRLTYLGNLVSDEDAAAILASVPEGKMNANVQTALTSAKETFEASKTTDNYAALQTAIANANTSIAAYATAKSAIDKAKDIQENTNVATAAAATTFAEAINAIELSYTAGSLTDADANAAGNTLGVVVSGWHANANGAAGKYMESAWDNAENFGDYYINTWSIEGENDGSNFVVPFFEYWTGSGSLGAKTMTAIQAGLTPNGKYKVSVLARVSGNDKVANSITLQVGDGSATDITAGEKIGSTDRYFGTFTAAGSADADGNLTIKINVAANSNISWLSFKDVKYAEVEMADADDYTALANAITTAEANTLGFEAGEYAPYNNIAAVEALAAAKAIDQTAGNIKDDVQAATAALTAATWTANTEEVDAVYDGTFATATNNGAPLGWTMSNNTLGGDYHSRAFVGDDRLSEFNGTKSGLFLRFDGTNSDRGSQYTYGATEGYNMPLKAATTYLVKVNFTNWGTTDEKPLRLNVDGPNSFNVYKDMTSVKDADKGSETPDQFYIVFTTTEAGNYSLRFQVTGDDANKHNVLISNVTLKKAPSFAVVGCKQGTADKDKAIFSGAWDTATTTDVLTYADGVYTKTYTDLTLDKQTIDFKVVKQGAEVTWYPAGTDNNYSIDIPVNGKYNITFTFNEGTQAITGVATKTAEAVTIGEKGWATTVTNSPLDFSQQTDYFRAYTATVSDDNVTLAQVENVQEETGLVLHGKAGTYYLPVIGSSETGKGDLMHSSVYEYNITDGELSQYTFYGLTVKTVGDKNMAQFVKLEKGTIAPQKAFLRVENTGSSARELKVVFAGETTGIDSIAAETVAAEGVYNLNGQRVNAPAKKGLYIVNGKKVILK